MRIEHPELSLFGITRLAECCQTVIIWIFSICEFLCEYVIFHVFKVHVFYM